MVIFQHPVKLVHDDSGRLLEVIIAAEDFIAYLQYLAAETDWERLPEHLRDLIDGMIIDEILSERGEPLDLDTTLED